MWHCPATAEIRLDCGVAQDDPRWNTLAISEHLWPRLRPPAVWFTWPPPAEHAVVNEPHEWWLSTVVTGNIFTDGSLIDGPGPCGLAAWACYGPGPPTREMSGNLLAPFKTSARLSNTINHPFVSPLASSITCFSIGEILEEYVRPCWICGIGWPDSSAIGLKALSIRCVSPVTLTHCRSHSVLIGLSKHLPELSGLMVPCRVVGLQARKEQTCSRSSCLSARVQHAWRSQHVQRLTRHSDSVVSAARTLEKCMLLDPRTATRERSVKRRLPPAVGNSITSRPSRKNATLRLGPQLQGHVTCLDSIGQWRCNRCHEVRRTRSMYIRFLSTLCTGHPIDQHVLSG